MPRKIRTMVHQNHAAEFRDRIFVHAQITDDRVVRSSEIAHQVDRVHQRDRCREKG